MSVFKFKKFTIIQEQSAMKVGTDGVLLGAWVPCKESNTILDIGCGTGLITLMLAQRNPESSIVGIEIDKAASQEAQKNSINSDWKERIKINHTSLQDFTPKNQFDLIVSNPPFFPEDNSQERRAIARRTNTLSFKDLIQHAANLLSAKGVFAVIIPKDSEKQFCNIATAQHLYCSRVCNVKGNATAPVKRVMLAFSFTKAELKTEELTIEKSRHNYTDAYTQLCKDFYLKM